MFLLPARARALGALLGLHAETTRFLERRRSEIDVVHLYSVFIPDNIAVASEVRRPYVVSPQGGYGTEVVRGCQRPLKALWIALRERLYVEAASLIQVLSPTELQQLRATF